MLSEITDVAPYAILFSLPAVLFGVIILKVLGERSLPASMAVLVLVPLVAELVGVLWVSGFMFSVSLDTNLLISLLSA
ncbi:MAG TPA: sensor histidine kinase, partial [Pseudonocardiaceae bacterium]